MSVEQPAQQPAGPFRPISITAVALAALTSPYVAYEEGVIPYTYADPIGIPTICAGETGPHVQFGQKTTIEDCLRRLDPRLTATWKILEPCIKRPIEVHSAMALLSAADNLGTGTICGSTMIRLINAGQPAVVWCAQLTNAKNRKGEETGFTYAGGRRLNGLIKRRTRERALCVGDPNWMKAA